MIEASHRERSKARRRDAIERSALALFAAKGFEATTIGEIAAQAEVAPRTVSLYFPAKTDLVMAPVNAACERLTAMLTARADDDTLADVFSRWLQDEHDRVDPELRRLRAATFAASPGLRALRSVQTEEALRTGARALAEQLHLPEDHYAVRIALAAVVSVLDEYAAIRAGEHDAAGVHAVVVTFLAGGLEAVTAALPASL